MRRETGSSPPSGGEDIDLTSALRARREAQPESRESSGRSHAVRRRPGLRTGGRVRMERSKANAVRQRSAPIPGAPPYRKNGRRPDIGRIVLGAIAAAAGLAGVVYIFASPKLAITHVRIDGVSQAEADALVARMPIEPLGHNLPSFLLGHGLAERRWLASAEPYFAGAAISARLPHTLDFRVVDRPPFAVLRLAGKTYILDQRAVPIYAGEHSRISSGLPSIVLSGTSVQPGALVLGAPLPDSEHAEVEEAFDLLGRLGKHPGLGDVQSVQVDKSGDLGLNMANDFRVRLGQPNQLDEKLSLAESLLRQRPDMAAEARYLDVSYPARPAMMPRSAASVGVVGGAAVAPATHQ